VHAEQLVRRAMLHLHQALQLRVCENHGGIMPEKVTETH
jgi:hypothetical protein